MAEEHGRPLTDVEAAALNHMLSVELPGIARLRAQAATARVTRRWSSQDPSIDLTVEPTEDMAPGDGIERVVATAVCNDPDTYGATHLMLWVKDGCLSGLELACYKDAPDEFLPPPEAFDPPEEFRRPVRK
jgi:hypothetical protein